MLFQRRTGSTSKRNSRTSAGKGLCALGCCQSTTGPELLQGYEVVFSAVGTETSS